MKQRSLIFVLLVVCFSGGITSRAASSLESKSGTQGRQKSGTQGRQTSRAQGQKKSDPQGQKKSGAQGRQKSGALERRHPKNGKSVTVAKSSSESQGSTPDVALSSPARSNFEPVDPVPELKESVRHFLEERLARYNPLYGPPPSPGRSLLSSASRHSSSASKQSSSASRQSSSASRQSSRNNKAIKYVHFFAYEQQLHANLTLVGTPFKSEDVMTVAKFYLMVRSSHRISVMQLELDHAVQGTVEIVTAAPMEKLLSKLSTTAWNKAEESLCKAMCDDKGEENLCFVESKVERSDCFSGGSSAESNVRTVELFRDTRSDSLLHAWNDLVEKVGVEEVGVEEVGVEKVGVEEVGIDSIDPSLVVKTSKYGSPLNKLSQKDSLSCLRYVLNKFSLFAEDSELETQPQHFVVLWKKLDVQAVKDAFHDMVKDQKKNQMWELIQPVFKEKVFGKFIGGTEFKPSTEKKYTLKPVRAGEEVAANPAQVPSRKKSGGESRQTVVRNNVKPFLVTKRPASNLSVLSPTNNLEYSTKF